MCRNTLMYFNAETQSRILRHFHFALVDSGALMLGKSEMMITHRELFAPAELKHRIFVKQSRTSIASRASSFGAGEAGPQPNGDDERTARDAALELGAQAHAIVSRSGRLMFANLPARALFQDLARGSRPPAGRAAAGRGPGRVAGAGRAGAARAPAGAPSARSRSRRTAATRAGSRSASRRCSRPTTSRSRPASSSRTSRATRRCRPSSRAIGATSSWPMRSCSRRSTSSRRPTRSCSPPTRSCRRPTRSSSRPTRSSRP